LDKWDKEEKQEHFLSITMFEHKEFPKPEHEGAMIIYRGDTYFCVDGKWVRGNA